MRALSLAFALPCALGLALAASAPSRAQDDTAKALQKPIKAILEYLKLAKYPQASAYLDHEAMAKDILRATWGTMSESDRKEFVEGFAFLMERLSFPKVHENFQYLSEDGYDPPVLEGEGRARLPSYVVIDHPTKDEETINLEFVLLKSGDGWRIFDVFVEGESTLDGIREDQVEELLDEGGVALLMKRLREKVAELKAKEG